MAVREALDDDFNGRPTNLSKILQLTYRISK